MKILQEKLLAQQSADGEGGENLDMSYSYQSSAVQWKVCNSYGHNLLISGCLSLFYLITFFLLLPACHFNLLSFIIGSFFFFFQVSCFWTLLSSFLIASFFFCMCYCAPFVHCVGCFSEVYRVPLGCRASSHFGLREHAEGRQCRQEGHQRGRSLSVSLSLSLSLSLSPSLSLSLSLSLLGTFAQSANTSAVSVSRQHSSYATVDFWTVNHTEIDSFCWISTYSSLLILFFRQMSKCQMLRSVLPYWKWLIGNAPR